MKVICAVLICSVMSDSFDSMDYSPPGSSVNGDSPVKNTGVGSHALLQGIFPTQIKLRSPTLQADFSLTEPTGKPIKVI